MTFFEDDCESACVMTDTKLENLASERMSSSASFVVRANEVGAFDLVVFGTLVVLKFILKESGLETQILSVESPPLLTLKSE